MAYAAHRLPLRPQLARVHFPNYGLQKRGTAVALLGGIPVPVLRAPPFG